MRLMRWIFIPIAFLLPLLAPATAARADESRLPDPLFQSHELLEIHLSGPISTLIAERADDEYLPAKLAWSEPDGRRIEVDIGLRARGNFRRKKDTCRFPPIRLNFRTADVKGTVFHKQDALKLVTHCKDNSARFEQLVVKEYLTYRMLQALTDLSYRVRLLQVRYTDTDNDRDDHSSLGIVIEHKDRFAKRTGLKEVNVPGTRLSSLDPAYTNLMSVFHYMIGNTDFSPIAGAAGDDCCHNANLFAADGQAIFPVPYDFDMSGMVDAPYAAPNPRFKLRSVRHRLYRGHCVNNAHLPTTLQAFRDQRETFYALVDNDPRLSKSSAKSMRKFLDSFFDTLDNRKSVDRTIIQRCRGSV